MNKQTTFDPMAKDSKGQFKYLRAMRGGALYMDVKFRQLWLVSDSPYNCVETELVEHDPGKSAVFKATVVIRERDDQGCIVELRRSTSYGSETVGDFGDYLEKAETKAIGRALINVGFGTQFSGFDFDYEKGVRDLNEANPGRNKYDGVDSGTPAAVFEGASITDRLKDAVTKHGKAAVQAKAFELFQATDSGKLNADQKLQLAEWAEATEPAEAAVAS